MTTLALQPDGASGIDTYLFKGEPAWNYGTTGWFTAGGWSAPDAHPNKGLIKFDLSAIPAGATILSATLRLGCVLEQSTTDYAVAVHRSLVQWYEGNSAGAVPGAGVNASTWNYRNANGSVAWTGGQGGAAGIEYAAGATDTRTITGTAFYNFTVTADVQGFINGTYTNHGWWVIGDTPADSAKIFSASDDGTAGNRPRLTVTYTFLISGSAGGSATAMADMTGQIEMSGSAAGAAGAGGTLTDVNLMGAAVAGAATVTGDVLGRGYVAANAAGAATPGGHLTGGTELGASAAGRATVSGDAIPVGVMRSNVAGAALVNGRMWGKAKGVVTPRQRNAAPLLYLTDGVDRLDLLDPRAGFLLCGWRPAVAQYKGGGQFADSALAHGRRLVSKRFANAIEVMELSAQAKDQDELIAYTADLLRWLEAAASYWTSRWATRPVYLVARSAFEENARYAIIHMGSVPELENVYGQPFLTSPGYRSARGAARPGFERITLRLERGPWLDNPPGQGSCVEVSALRSWTVAGWASSDTGGSGGGSVVSGDVLAMVQAGNGDILIGTNAGAALFRSDNEGQTWSAMTSLGTGSDAVNALVRDGQGNLFAAVTGGSSSAGVWRSTNHGASWTRVKTHPAGTGYTDLAWIHASGTLVAVGKAAGSGAASPVAMLRNGVWSEPVVMDWYRDLLAVGAPDYPYLHTAYPGESATAPEAFSATDSYYTVGYRLISPTHLVAAGAVPLNSGQMGNGGLDMVAYSFPNANRSGVYRRALWAVRAASDTDNTEIWQWPDPTAAFPTADRFAKIATIPDVIFNALYVDPTPDYTQAQRTIWAGADGAIYVSYNSGYSWSLATDAPANRVRVILRTAAGTLLAGCDNAEVFLFAGGGSSGSEGGGSGGSVVTGGSTVSSQPLGRVATCADEVYVSNKTSFSNITHVLVNDGGVYTELQFATSPPYALLPSTPAVNDALYLGCKTSDSNVASGPFSSAVFDLSEVAEDVTVTWEYYNGSTWASLTVQDNTAGFRVPGVGSVHWVAPSDWSATAVNSITGYWVRARVSAVGSAPVGPVHAHEDLSRADPYIYTANLPYVEIDAAQIGGDVPALAQILWTNRGDNPGSTPSMEAHRLLVGLRTVDRGSAFDAYINLSDRQTPFGVTITAATGSFEAANGAPTGRRYTVSFSGGDLNTWQDLLTVSLSTTIARDYFGDFRVFLRAYVASGDDDDWRFRLATGFGSGGRVSTSREVYGKPAQVDYRLLDLGIIQVPNTALPAGQIGDELSITVQGYATAGSVAAKLYDLILLPVDEWAGDFLHANLSDSQVPSALAGTNILDVDSITNPKTVLDAYARQASGLIKAIYQPVANGEAMLQVGVRQRLWFVAATYAFASNSWGAPPQLVGTVRVNKAQQYLGLRGAR